MQILSYQSIRYDLSNHSRSSVYVVRCRNRDMVVEVQPFDHAGAATVRNRSKATESSALLVCDSNATVTNNEVTFLVKSFSSSYHHVLRGKGPLTASLP